MAESTSPDSSELKLKYKQFSSISDHWLHRIKKFFITFQKDEWDVIFVTMDDTVYGFGDNIWAILDLDTEVKVSNPMVIEELCGKDLKKVVFGDRFVAVLTESNELYTGGLCEYGRCGNGINDIIWCKPKKISIAGQSVVDVCCGFHYTVILTDRQQVYTFGSYSSDGTNSNSTPTLISLFDFEKITSISCGWHALALTETGKVYAWGCNCSGELGLNHNSNQDKPKLVEMPNNVSVKQISCGNCFSLLLTTEGNIYSFGYNEYGQLGLNNTDSVSVPTLISTTSKFTEILALCFQSFAMNESNVIEFWGDNISEECVLTPHKTDANSLQEAIIHYSNFPVTIEPIVVKKEDTKHMTANRVMRNLIKGFNNPKNSDFKFKIKCQEWVKPNTSDDPNNGYDIIYCQKWFVEENCEHLKELFANRKSVKESNEIEIKGFSYETYFHFIQYLYTDSIETKDMNTLNELLLLSDIYSEEDLRARSVSLIKSLLDVENVCDFYCSAIINKSSDLEKYCFEFMTKNMKTIVKTKGYSQMNPKITKIYLAKYFEQQK